LKNINWKREKKKLEKNEGKEEEDDNPASDTNYMSADEETEDKESAKKVRAFEYHIALINLIARCCGGENSTTEGMAQDLASPEECVKIICNPICGGHIKAAYCRFLGEVWLNTGRKTQRNFKFLWDFFQFATKEIDQINKENENIPKEMKEYYIEGILPIISFYFSQNSSVSSENMPIVKKLFDVLIESLSSKLLEPHYEDIVINIEAMKASVKELPEIAELVTKIKKLIEMDKELAIGSESSVKKDEKNKKQQLAHYVVRMKKQLDSRGLQVERSELLAVTHLFKSRFTSSTEKTENKHFDAPARPNLIKGQTAKLLNNLDALNLFKNQKSELDSYDGVLSTKKIDSTIGKSNESNSIRLFIFVNNNALQR